LEHHQDQLRTAARWASALTVVCCKREIPLKKLNFIHLIHLPSRFITIYHDSSILHEFSMQKMEPYGTQTENTQTTAQYSSWPSQVAAWQQGPPVAKKIMISGTAKGIQKSTLDGGVHMF